MQFKRSAGIFVSGVFMSIAGYIFGAFCAGSAAAAGRIGEELARAHEKSAREAAAAEDQMGRELMARLEGERAAARAQLAPALDARWWENAKAEDIVRVHRTATAWKSQDPMARSAADAICEQVQQRYGIDVDGLGTGSDSAAALTEAARPKTHDQKEQSAAGGETPKPTGFSQKPNGPTKPNASTWMPTTFNPNS